MAFKYLGTPNLLKENNNELQISFDDVCNMNVSKHKTMVAGLISITVTPKFIGLLKDTVDFSQYKSDSTSRPARGWRSHLMSLTR